MSRIEWQWRDEGSGPGYMQKVLVHEPEDAVREAFRRWLNHGAACRICKADESRCERGQRLQVAHRAARRRAASASL